MSPVVETFERLTLPGDRRAVVARFATRWFVLTGFTDAPLATYAVDGPHDKHLDATRAALLMHGRACASASGAET